MIPYLVHNDFLEIGAESGVYPCLVIYSLFFSHLLFY